MSPKEIRYAAKALWVHPFNPADLRGENGVEEPLFEVAQASHAKQGGRLVQDIVRGDKPPAAARRLGQDPSGLFMAIGRLQTKLLDRLQDVVCIQVPLYTVVQQ